MESVIVLGSLVFGDRFSIINRFIFLLVTAASVSACIYSDANSLHPNLRSMTVPLLSDGYVITRNRHFVIPIASNIYIPMPKSGIQMEEDAEAVENKSKKLMEVQTTAFAAHFAHVRSGKIQMSVEEALRFAKEQQMNFLLYAHVREWQDMGLLKKGECKQETVVVETPREISATQTLTACDWNFANPMDKAGLSIWMYEVNSRQLVDVITVDSTSGALTFLGDTPLSLLKRPLSKLAQTYSAQ
ncbi:MAG: DUF4823 domain-containing protein [Pseudomonadales bacterium]|nr:DUF4823 domain-containing protein [Pseudomonadales bacterium]